MLKAINDAEAFKRTNLASWESNTSLWLAGRMRHLRDVRASLTRLLTAALQRAGGYPPTVVDMGCGDAWILPLLAENAGQFRYVGIDFNERILGPLRERYANQSNVEFRCLDLEKQPPADLSGRADLVVNAFNFFELPNLAAGFATANLLMRPDGVLLAATIDPLTQLIAISTSLEHLLAMLKEWAESKTALEYSKPVDLIDGPSDAVYYGVLYSLQDFFVASTQAGLSLQHYEEVRSTSTWPPQIYQLLRYIR